MAVSRAGGDVGVIDHIPPRACQVVFLGRGAVGVLGHPADRGVLQMDDDRAAGVQLAVELVQAFGQAARKAAVAARRPDRAVRPHSGARILGAVQDGAGVAQRVQAALAGGLVADGKDLPLIEGEQLDAAEVFQTGGGRPGQGGEEQDQGEQKRRQGAAETGGGVHGKQPSFWKIKYQKEVYRLKMVKV